MSTLTGKVLSGMGWRFGERVCARLVTFSVTVVLARLLAPEDFGTVALLSVVITLLAVFVHCGFGSALIQKKAADDLDFSSVFYFNLFSCTLLYILLYIVSPFIATFYNRPEIKRMIRVAGLVLLISGVKSIQNIYVSRNLLFKKFFYATLGGTIFSAFIGIFFAYRGYGTWALIFQNLSNDFIDTCILWFTIPWHPRLYFSMTRLKGLAAYGWRILASSLFDTLFREIRQLIIGKYYSPTDLAFYNKGSSLPHQIVNNICSSIDSVMFPVMSKAQDDILKLRNMVRRSIQTSTFFMMPLMMGLAFCAEPLIRLLLTSKWLPCVFFLRIFCFSYAFYPVHTANLNAIKALGRSDLFLYLEVAKKIVGLTAILSTMWISVKAMAYSLIVTSVLCQIINAWPNRRLLGYSYLDQLLDMFPQIALSCVMGLTVYSVQFLGLNDWLTLALQVPTGAICYILGSWIFHLESFHFLWSLIKQQWKKRMAR